MKDRSLPVALMLVCLSSPLQAATSTQFTVSATVTRGCQINDVPPASGSAVGVIGQLNFGQQKGLTTTPIQASYQKLMTLSCTPNITLNMSIDGGLNFQSGSRNLRNGSFLQPYQLYRDAGFTQTIPVNTQIAVPVGTGTDIQLPVYGRLTLLSAAPVGTYQDTLTVTLQW